MMYSEHDLNQAKSSLRTFILLYCLFVALVMGGLVVALVLRTAWLLYAAAAVLTLLSLFLWGNYGIRLIVWRRFLRDMHQGLEREVIGVLDTVDAEVSVRDGLEFRAIRLMTGEESDKAGGRLLYVDASRFPLPVNPGQKINCKLFGNYVKGITALEEE